MTDVVKADIKALEYMVTCAQHAQRTRNPLDKLAAVKLEVEFSDRIAALKKQDDQPELSGIAGVHGGGR